MSESNENHSNTAGSSQLLGDDEEIVKLDDIIKHQDDMMEEVAAVLGAGDDFNCSYNQGHMKRQALYACLTCVPQGKEDFKKAAGFCLGCSYHCHDGHNLIELYTKRNFRCDCGNLKFGDAHCNLDANKEDFNYDNIYNQNFSGLYCTCHKPYPDPEDNIDDDMIQCIICEDWYHSRHLNTPSVEDFAEMMCETCVTGKDFLMNYVGLAITKIQVATTDEIVTVTADPNPNPEEPQGMAAVEENKADNSQEHATTEETAMETETNETSATQATPVSITESLDSLPAALTTTESGKTQSDKCTKPIPIEKQPPKTLYMKDLSWREQLCKCVDCMNIYKEHKCVYLLDPEDTVEFYEKKGKEKYQDAKKRAIEAEQEMLKSMPRAPLLDAMAGYNDFKEQLAQYLKQFADQQKVCTVDDVKEFFSNLQNNKRQKMSENTYFCR